MSKKQVNGKIVNNIDHSQDDPEAAKTQPKTQSKTRSKTKADKNCKAKMTAGKAKNSKLNPGKGKGPKKEKRKAKLLKGVPVVFCQDVNAFVSKVAQLRGLPNMERAIFKFGIDDGQGHLKINLSIIDRLKGSSGKDEFSDRGVKKIFVIAQAPATECHQNLRLLLNKISFHTFEHPYIITADLKLIAIACGLSNAGTAKHPCPVCEWEKNTKVKGNPKRSFQSMQSWHQLWLKKTGGNENLVKNFKNCVREALPVNPSDCLVFDLFACPTLHLFLGIFNHMYEKFEEIWPGVNQWARKLNVKRKGYFGHVFEVRNE